MEKIAIEELAVSINTEKGGNFVTQVRFNNSYSLITIATESTVARTGRIMNIH